MASEKTVARDLIFKYNRVQFVWSDDNKQCKAVFYNDDTGGSEMESVDCKVCVEDRDLDTGLVWVSAYLEYPYKGDWHCVADKQVYDPDCLLESA